VTPELKPGAFEEAAAHARSCVLNGSIPCALVAAASRERVWAMRAYNGRGEEDRSLIRGVFPLASVTKAIAGVGIARMVEKGLLDYADPVARHLPEFGRRAWRRTITLGSIFTHCTGLQPRPMSDCLVPGGPGPDDFLALFADEPAYEPGTRFQYTTLTYQLLNAIVRRSLEMRMSEFLREYVFVPCGMEDTGFRVLDPARLVPSVNHPAATPEALGRFEEMELSGAGLWSGASDLVRLAQALLTPGKLLSPEGFARHTRRQPSLPAVAGDKRSYRTWGWNREPQPSFPHQSGTGFYHGGAAGDLLWIDPARDLIFVFLSARWGSGNEHDFAALDRLYA
jgi:serine-type D-Ala-D-Ala carboxypeptidase